MMRIFNTREIEIKQRSVNLTEKMSDKKTPKKNRKKRRVHVKEYFCFGSLQCSEQLHFYNFEKYQGVVHVLLSLKMAEQGLTMPTLLLKRLMVVVSGA